jgi:hypothetical protein
VLDSGRLVGAGLFRTVAQDPAVAALLVDPVIQQRLSPA